MPTIGSQPGLHTVAASITYNCSIHHTKGCSVDRIRLQVVMPFVVEHFPKANVKARSLRSRTSKSRGPSWCRSPLPWPPGPGGATAPDLLGRLGRATVLPLPCPPVGRATQPPGRATQVPVGGWSKASVPVQPLTRAHPAQRLTEAQPAPTAHSQAESAQPTHPQAEPAQPLLHHQVHCGGQERLLRTTRK